jgi:hypothetical protein
MAKTSEQEKKQNAIVAADMQLNGAGLVLKSAADLKLVAELFINSGVVPHSFDTAAKIAVVVEAGQELGFKPWQSIQNFHIVQGQLGLKSTAIGGLIRSSGVCKHLKQSYSGKEGTDSFCAVVTSQRKDDVTEHETSFSVADAKAAGLWGKDNWKHYPKDMLMWRALSRHGRAFYGDVLCGFYSAEELAEVHPPAEQPTPEVPPREERKHIESEVKNGKAVLQDELNKLLIEFRKYAEFALQADLGDVSGPIWNQAFAKFASAYFQDDSKDYRQIDAYTLDVLAELGAALKADGIPDDALDIIRQTGQMLTTEEAEQHAEEKLRNYKYKCQACEHTFDEQPKKKMNKWQCPKCLRLQVVELQEAEVADE